MTDTAQIICSAKGTDIGQCRTQHLRTRNELPPPPPNGWPDLRGLNQLQASREEWLNGTAIEKALFAYHDALPSQTQDLIHIQDTSLANFFDSDDATFNTLLAKPLRRFFAGLLRKEYTLWPCNYGGNHWMLAIMRKGRSSANIQGFDQVLQVAVIDGWRNQGTPRRYQVVSTRLRTILQRAGLTILPDAERIMWVPWQQDGWSCGLRMFWTARNMMDRIQETMDRNGYDEQIWGSLPGWFNPDQVRWEMIGLNAHEAVKEMNYRGRFAVEVVSRVARDNRNGVEQVDAQISMQPPPKKGPDTYEKPPVPRERPVNPIPRPNERRVAPSGSIASSSGNIRQQGQGQGQGTIEDPVWVPDNTPEPGTQTPLPPFPPAPGRHRPSSSPVVDLTGSGRPVRKRRLE